MFGKLQAKTTVEGGGGREYKTHVLRGKNLRKGIGQTLVQLREELVGTTTSTFDS